MSWNVDYSSLKLMYIQTTRSSCYFSWKYDISQNFLVWSCHHTRVGALCMYAYDALQEEGSALDLVGEVEEELVPAVRVVQIGGVPGMQ